MNHAAPEVSLRQRLAANLRFLIKEAEQSQREAGRGAGADPKTINNMTHGHHDVRISSIQKAARHFDLEAWQLLAVDFDALPADRKDVLRLLELFARSDEAGRQTILSVAAIAASSS
jgi:transcriptional regulator with XRE-family HTH domain